MSGRVCGRPDQRRPRDLGGRNSVEESQHGNHDETAPSPTQRTEDARAGADQKREIAPSGSTPEGTSAALVSAATIASGMAAGSSSVEVFGLARSSRPSTSKLRSAAPAFHEPPASAR